MMTLKDLLNQDKKVYMTMVFKDYLKLFKNYKPEISYIADRSESPESGRIFIQLSEFVFSDDLKFHFSFNSINKVTNKKEKVELSFDYESLKMMIEDKENKHDNNIKFTALDENNREYDIVKSVNDTYNEFKNR